MPLRMHYRCEQSPRPLELPEAENDANRFCYMRCFCPPLLGQRHPMLSLAPRLLLPHCLPTSCPGSHLRMMPFLIQSKKSSGSCTKRRKCPDSTPTQRQPSTRGVRHEEPIDLEGGCRCQKKNELEPDLPWSRRFGSTTSLDRNTCKTTLCVIRRLGRGRTRNLNRVQAKVLVLSTKY